MRFSIHHDIDGEVLYLRRTVQDLPWLREQGYDVLLPEGVDEYSTAQDIRAAVRREFFFEKEKLFEPEIQRLGERIRRHQKKIDAFFAEMFPRLRVPEEIRIFITAYGPGGGYNVRPPCMRVRLEAEPQMDPFHTVIHEAIHIVIEKPIVQRYELWHEQKETLVDELCSRATFLRGFRKQGFDAEIPPGLLGKL